MKEQFQTKKFSAENLRLLQVINQIITEYAAEGYDLTVRQTYYQLVARNEIPNTQESYDKIQALIGNARLAGLLDWGMIRDRARTTHIQDTYPDAAAFVTAYMEHFSVDRWAGQPYHVEVMVEKQALEGVLLPVCQELFCPFSANKGYSSLSMLYRTGKRLQERTHLGKKHCVVLYLGDHDPSGQDMGRDIEERLSMFAQTPIEVRRIALNMDQVEHYHMPENPAKLSDSRAAAYVERFGNSSWELDAFPVDALARLVKAEVEKLIDQARWDIAYQRGEAEREKLHDIVNALKEDL